MRANCGIRNCDMVQKSGSHRYRSNRRSCAVRNMRRMYGFCFISSAHTARHCHFGGVGRSSALAGNLSINRSRADPEEYRAPAAALGWVDQFAKMCLPNLEKFAFYTTSATTTKKTLRALLIKRAQSSSAKCSAERPNRHTHTDTRARLSFGCPTRRI